MSYFLNETLCQKLPLTDERQRYFLDIIRTRLNVGSPLFIQNNSLNIFFIAQESLNHINKVKKDEKKYITYLKSSLNEILTLQKEDLVYKNLTLPFEIIKENIEKCIKSENFSHSDYNLELLEYNLNLILESQENYEKIALDKLHYSLFIVDFDISKCERVFSEIRNYSKHLISQLLFKGYSSIYLYHRLEQFTKIKNYKGNNFKTQFERIIGSLINKKSEITLYLPIKIESKLENIAILNLYNFSFVSDDDENDHIKQKINQIKKNINQPNIYFIKYEVKTTDYLSAIFQLKSKIEKICDFYIHENQLKFYNYIIAKNGQTAQEYSLDKIWKTTFSNQWYINETKNAFELENLVSGFNSNSQETILQSLRYLKIGSGTQNVEQKILNLWISLESLFSWHKSDSILNAMNNFVPYFTFIDEIRCKINFIKNILKKYNSSINDIIIKRLDLKETEYMNLKTPELLKILNSKDDFNRMLDDLKKMDYAKSLIIEQQLFFKDIELSFKIHKEDCEKNLKRIYYYRNRIAHLGHYEKIPNTLILMLQSYIYSCYFSLTFNNISFNNIKNSDISGSFELTKLIIQKNLNKNIFELL